MAPRSLDHHAIPPKEKQPTEQEPACVLAIDNFTRQVLARLDEKQGCVPDKEARHD